ncbi:Arc family DNA-binding protein [Cedecea sp. NFIX57]|uniref:Arc family DNA-binding protein n=1 Tax=Cedecea sp. NFIX57 TaxID=1566286 RepID=UPI000A0D223E|nr:Arc family DNA-binding protein [Cedecea sp. NFIX57]SMG61747.1 Arc-like DNA binding domain-containing protein [Cedecea sp. NFIX57]
MSKREPQINLRLPQELKDKVHEIAAENHRSVNSELVRMIEACVAEYYFFKESEGQGHYSFEELEEEIGEEEISEEDYERRINRALSLMQESMKALKEKS